MARVKENWNAAFAFSDLSFQSSQRFLWYLLWIGPLHILGSTFFDRKSQNSVFLRKHYLIVESPMTVNFAINNTVEAG